jgi:phage baseplate assembly protein W
MRKVISISAVLAIASLLIGCGGGGSSSGTDGVAGPSGSVVASHKLDLMLPDCSASFRRASGRLVPEMIEVALNSAAQNRALWAACFAGAPLQDLYWDVRIDFGNLPSSLTSNGHIGEKVNAARALGLRSDFRRIIDDTPRSAPGSGQREAHELASQTPHVGRVFMFTDALIQEPEGVVLRTATHDEVKAVINRWAPRMKGLQGVELVFVGVGLGAESAKSVRNAQELFSGIAGRVGASFSWTRNLPLAYSEGGQ